MALGNFTKVEGDRDVRYYRVRYNYLYADLLFRQRIMSFFNISAGPLIYNYWNHLEDNQDKILSTPSLVGLDSANVYKTKLYAGGKMAMQINTVNSELLPTRGFLMEY